MFIGEYHHSLDAKGRIAIPAKYRDDFGRTAYISKGLDGCLNIYTKEGYQKRFDAIIALNSNKKDVREYQRSILSSSLDCDLDGQGRILINAQFAQMAGLSKECVFIGVGDHVELWSETRWDEYRNAITEEQLESISETL